MWSHFFNKGKETFSIQITMQVVWFQNQCFTMAMWKLVCPSSVLALLEDHADPANFWSVCHLNLLFEGSLLLKVLPAAFQAFCLDCFMTALFRLLFYCLFDANCLGCFFGNGKVEWTFFSKQKNKLQQLTKVNPYSTHIWQGVHSSQFKTLIQHFENQPNLVWTELIWRLSDSVHGPRPNFNLENWSVILFWFTIMGEGKKGSSPPPTPFPHFWLVIILVVGGRGFCHLV